jgi:methyl-accepting chemotaxis protein
MSSSFDTSENLFVADDQEAPRFQDLFDEPGMNDEDYSDDGGTDDTDAKPFEKLETVSEDPKPYFRNTSFYQDALTGEGEIAKRMHSTLAQFLKAENPEDRSLYRNRLIPVYWDLAKAIALKAYGGLPDPKRLVLRFGVLLPTMIDKDQRVMIAQIITENRWGQPIHYVDEWLKKVAAGEVGVSATDETKAASGQQASKVSRQVETVRGKVEAQITLIKTRNDEMQASEATLRQMVGELLDREPRPETGGSPGPYTEAQRSLFSGISSELRRLSNQGRELGRAYAELERYQDNLQELKQQAEEAGEDLHTVDTKASAEELNTVRQMAKMCVGRQGNHFPLLYKQYFRGGLSTVATRENVHNVLAEVEYLDPGIFQRTFKQKTTRIVPNFILVPCYGDLGICWEPFERFNRATSRGRLAIPMYGKDLKPAVIAALGDLRWQVAKEKAAHYWMEEGLTGWYYQWFAEQKLKGDVKDQFIQDYILWLTKECEGTQKLAREVRDIFWRYIPFPQDIKEKLKNRGFVYQELYKKDQNRAMSDGY